jgi:hypothetical protein
MSEGRFCYANWRYPGVLGLLCLVVVAGYGNSAGAADSFSFEKLLMPGELIEGHAEYEEECSNCHGDDASISQTSLCLDCHEDVASDIQQTRGFHGPVTNAGNRECKDCHSDHIGRQGDIVNLDKDSFDHSQTDFELKDKHVGIVCASCHLAEKKYRQAPNRCFTCHETEDRHQGAFGKECQDCHSPAGWSDTDFDHGKTKFSLLGRHQEIQCNACHPDEKYSDTPSACFSCHAINDVHNNRNGEQCEKCHSATGWEKLSFDHNKDTDFALKDGHGNLACNACHQQSGFDKKLSTLCIDCHQNDDEHNGQNGEKCDSCHSVKLWAKITFDHGRDTKFSLRGKHAELICESCHRDGTAGEELGTACLDCHRIDDVHQGKQGQQCNNCHNSIGWLNSIRFNHDLTSFPLLGMHSVTSCDSCHGSKEFSDTENECVACHEPDDFHDRALGPDCGACHNPNDWQLWSFDHDTQTDFELDGAHKGLSCNECHYKPVKSKSANARVKQSSTCSSCHLNDDVHSRRFGRACERCHTTESFKEITVQ